jgi:hypothetical protein
MGRQWFVSTYLLLASCHCGERSGWADSGTMPVPELSGAAVPKLVMGARAAHT